MKNDSTKPGMMRSPPPAPFGGKPACRVAARFDGRTLRLTLERKDGVVTGEFATDGAVGLTVESSTGGSGVPALPAVPDKPARAATPPGGGHERAPLGPARRTVLMDDRGEPYRVEWIKVTPAYLARILSYESGPLIPARGRNVPYGRCHEYYDENGRLCRTEWGIQRPAFGATRKAA